MNNDADFISEWFYLLLESLQPFVLEWGKLIALAVLSMIVVLLLLLLALWLQGVGQQRRQLSRLIGLSAMLLIAGTALAETAMRPTTTHDCECGMWKVSVAAMYAGVGLDAASSWKKPELNPMYRSADGRFGAQGLVLRLALPIGATAIQRFVLARTDAKWVRRTFTVINFFAAGTSTAVAARNWRL